MLIVLRHAVLDRAGFALVLELKRRLERPDADLFLEMLRILLLRLRRSRLLLLLSLLQVLRLVDRLSTLLE